MRKEYDAGNRAACDYVAENYGYGQDQDGDICLVMELLEGGNFRDFILDKNRPKDDEHLFSLICDFTYAITTCHSAGIYHRDIKPENLMMTKD